MKLDLCGSGVVEIRFSVKGKPLIVRDNGTSQKVDCVWDEVTALMLESNLLTSLPTLPKGLKTLKCSNNQLSSLPDLPKGLKRLDCSINSLETLPKLPRTLRHLTCSDNLLKALPKLPRDTSRDCAVPVTTSHLYLSYPTDSSCCSAITTFSSSFLPYRTPSSSLCVQVTA